MPIDYGVSQDAIRSYELKNGISGLLDKYNGHRHRAKARGIAFKLTLAQWMELWDGKIKKMGQRKDCFVMCRTKDEGAYEVGNVRIATPYENALDRFEKRSHWTRRGCGRLPAVQAADRAEDALLSTIREYSR